MGQKLSVVRRGRGSQPPPEQQQPSSAQRGWSSLVLPASLSSNIASNARQVKHIHLWKSCRFSKTFCGLSSEIEIYETLNGVSEAGNRLKFPQESHCNNQLMYAGIVKLGHQSPGEICCVGLIGENIRVGATVEVKFCQSGPCTQFWMRVEMLPFSAIRALFQSKNRNSSRSASTKSSVSIASRLSRSSRASRASRASTSGYWSDCGYMAAPRPPAIPRDIEPWGLIYAGPVHAWKYFARESAFVRKWVWVLRVCVRLFTARERTFLHKKTQKERSDSQVLQCLSLVFIFQMISTSLIVLSAVGIETAKGTRSV